MPCNIHPITIKNISITRKFLQVPFPCLSPFLTTNNMISVARDVFYSGIFSLKPPSRLLPLLCLQGRPLGLCLALKHTHHDTINRPPGGICCVMQGAQAQCSVTARGMGREVGGRLKAEGPHENLWLIHVAESNTRLSSDCPPIKNKFLKKFLKKS